MRFDGEVGVRIGADGDAQPRGVARGDVDGLGLGDQSQQLEAFAEAIGFACARI